MNTYTKIPTIAVHILVLLLFYLLLIPLADAHESGYMGMGHMGSGHMGMGQMGMGHMGSGHMGSGHMGSGHMGMGHMGSDYMGMGFNYFNNLNLSDSQRKTIRNIHKKTRAQRWGLQEKIADYSDQLNALYNQDKPDAKKISKVYQQIFDIKRQQIELHINTRNQTYDVLTKKQQKEMKEWRSDSMESSRHHNRGGMGMHHMMR